jgi:hypothetical protein
MPEYGTIRTQRGLPIGSIQPWGGPLSQIPSGWILANGAELVAQEYPLLARILKDTYGGNGFGGDFPGYNGSFILPQTNQKGLADISQSNFANNEDPADGNLYTPPQRNTNIDDADSLDQVSQFIGEFGDLGFVSSSFSNTNLNFSYTPDPDGIVETIDFDSNLNSIAPDSAIAVVYDSAQLESFIRVNGQPLGTGGLGDGLSFKVVANSAVDPADPNNIIPNSATYSFDVINRGQGFVAGQLITILGSAFSAGEDLLGVPVPGVDGVNDLNLIILAVGDSTFEGTIEGQSLIPGFGIQEVFILGRKLSAYHFPSHTHGIPAGTAGYTTLNGDGDRAGNVRPGRGVGVIDNPAIAFDQIWRSERSCFPEEIALAKLSSFLDVNNCLDKPIGGSGGDPHFINFRIVGETGIEIIDENNAGPGPGIDTQPSPADTAQNFAGTPFTTGEGRYAIGCVAGTVPFRDHIPRYTTRFSNGIGKTWFNDSSVKALSAGAGAISTASSNWTDGPSWLNQLGLNGRLNPAGGSTKIPFSDNDSPITEPNYADIDPLPGGNDIPVSVSNVLFNSNALNYYQIDQDEQFNQQIVIEPHNHTGQINILYNGDGFRVPSRIVTKAQPFVNPDNIPNAFQVQFTNTPPSVSCIHLIRAY